MEINGFKQPELVALLDKHFDGESSRYDITPNKNYLTAMQLNRSETKNLNYEELRPEKIYALKSTTTDIQAGIQETSYNLFLDRKMAETYYYQNTPKDNLVLNHQVQHGIIICGDVNNDLLARLQMAPKDFNSMLVVSTMQADRFTNTQKQQIEQASKIAEKVFNEIPLKNEYAFNTLPRGAQQDLYKYYELTHKQNPKIIHTDAWAIQDKKEALAKAYRKSLYSMNLFSLLLSLAFAVNSELILRVFFGKEWIYLTPVFIVFSVLVFFNADGRIADCYLRSLGKTKQQFYFRIVEFVTKAIGVIVGSHWGLIGVAIGVTLMECFVKMIKMVYAGSLVSVSFGEIIVTLFKSCRFSIALILICLLVYMLVPSVLWGEIVLLSVFSVSSAIMFICFPNFVGEEYKRDLFPMIKKITDKVFRLNKQ